MKSYMTMLRKFRFSFSNTLFLLSFCITFVLMVFNGSILYRTLYDYIFQEIDSYHLGNLENTAEKLEQNLLQANQAASMLAQNDDFIQYLKNADTSEHSELMMRNMFFRYTYNNDCVSSLIIVTKNGALLTIDTNVTLSYDDVMIDREFSPLLLSAEPVLFVPSIQQTKDAQNSIFNPRNTLFFGVPILEDGENIAFMLIVLKSKFIETSMQEYMVIRYNDSDVIISSQILPEKYIPTIETMKTTTARSKIASYYGTDFYDGRFTLFYIYPRKTLFTKLRPVFLTFMGIFLLSIITAFFIARLLGKNLVKPLHLLNKTLTSYFNAKKEKFLSSFQKHNKYLTFRETIMLNFILAVFLPLLLFELLYIPLLKNTTEQYLTEQSASLFEKTYGNISSCLNNKQNFIKTIGSDYRIQTILYNTISQRSSYDTSSTNTQSHELIKMLEAYQILYSNNDLIYFYDPKGNLIYSTSYSESPSSTEDVIAFTNTSNTFSWQFGQKNIISQDVFGCLYHITHIQIGSSLGVIQSIVQESDLRQNYDYQQTQYLDYYLIDETGTVVSSTQPMQIGSVLNTSLHLTETEIPIMDQEKKQIVMTKSLPDTGLCFIMYYKLDSLDNFLTSIFYQQIIILVAFLCIIIALAYIFSINLTNPLKRFYRILEDIGLEFDGISTLLPQFPEDSAIMEINHLGHAFNEMAERIELLLDETITLSKKQGELETKKKTAEILALQSQINSHFLYNTFENINSCISSGLNEKAIDMIDSLSSLLRYSSKAHDLLVSLEQELSYLEKYFLLMNVRFDGKIQYINKIEQKFYNNSIVRLTLQPIVENSISHGLLSKKKGGTITISAFEYEEYLEIQVVDNGFGINPEHLKEINEQLQNDSDFNKIGIYNVNNRLKMALGSKYGLTIDSKLGEGTIAKIKLPKALFLNNSYDSQASY